MEKNWKAEWVKLKFEVERLMQEAEASRSSSKNGTRPWFSGGSNMARRVIGLMEEMEMADTWRSGDRWNGLREYLAWKRMRLLEDSAKATKERYYSTAKKWKQMALAVEEVEGDMDIIAEWSDAEFEEWRRRLNRNEVKADDGEAGGQ